MPNETDIPELQPHDVDDILTEWQSDDYHMQLAKREAAHESDTITNNMFEESDRLRSQSAERQPATINFEELQPKDVQAREQRRREESDRAYERYESNPLLTQTEIGQKVAQDGLGEVVERDGEVVSPEFERERLEISERDRRNTAQHASAVHHGPKRSTTIWRAKGSIQRDIADNDQKVKTERELRGEI
jgi:hypothetical protein